MSKLGVDLGTLSALLALLLSASGCPAGYIGGYAAGSALHTKQGRICTGLGLRILAEEQLSRGFKNDAAESARNAIEIFKDTGQQKTRLYSSSLLLFAMTSKDDPSRHEEAIEALRSSISLTSPDKEKERSLHSSALGLLGEICVNDGDIGQAEPLLQRALAINAEHPDPYDSRAYAKCLHDLGVIRLMQRKMDEADGFFDRAIAVLKDAEDGECREMALSLNGKAFVLHAACKDAESKALMEQATTLLGKLEGPDSIELAKMQYDLACVHRSLGDLDEARRMCRRSLDVHTQQLGPDNPRTERVRQSLEKWQNADGAKEQKSETKQ